MAGHNSKSNPFGIDQKPGSQYDVGISVASTVSVVTASIHNIYTVTMCCPTSATSKIDGIDCTYTCTAVHMDKRS